MSRSLAYRQLGHLLPGDVVPASLYVCDYADGTRPRWTVRTREERAGGVIALVLVDPDNGADDLFDDGGRAALTVLTWPAKTLRSQPYPLGFDAAPILCDLDQQGRRESRERAA